MKIFKSNVLTGTNASLDIDITQKQYQRWKAGASLRVVAPQLKKEIRGFLITGILPDEQVPASETPYEN